MEIAKGRPGMYGDLLEMSDSAVFRLNRAAAILCLRGPFAGLAELDLIPRTKGMEHYHLLQATYGAFYAATENREFARAAYREALANVGTQAERRFLLKKL